MESKFKNKRCGITIWNDWIDENDRMNKDNKVNGAIDIYGNEYDLMNMLSCAMDNKNLRRIFYMAVRLDKIHNEKIGRRFDYDMYSDEDFIEKLKKIRDDNQRHH